MAMHILFRDQPRTLLLLTDEHALTFSYAGDADADRSHQSHGSEKAQYHDNANNGGSASQGSRVLVDFSPKETIDISKYRSLSSLPCYGCLGLIAVDGDVFLAVITGASKVAEPVSQVETVYRIHGLEFYCVSRANWDFTALDPAGNPLDSVGTYPGDNFDLATTSGGGAAVSSNSGMIEHPCASLKKLLTDGSFYYSNDFDLTSRLQSRSAEPTFDIEGFDETFMWNSFMISELVKFRSHLQLDEKEALDSSRFLTSVIRGFAETVPTRLGGIPASLTIISRQGCRRAGTRYNARGVDDEGNVANFVETETILYTPQFLFSYTQIRGSVPIFWEQDVQLLSAKVNITRAFEATQPAFMAHFEPLVTKYGPVHIVNLLAAKPGEQELTHRYRQHIKLASEVALANQLRETRFDFHSETAKAGYIAANKILRFLEDDAVQFGFFLYDMEVRAVVAEQTGAFRTNCLDCLDRTNLIQQIISRQALELFAEKTEILRLDEELKRRHSVLWADNGDQLSKIYAGTGALKTSFTRSGKMSIAGAIADATKSVSRMYINNFVDKGKQNTMDMLLGRLEGQEVVLLHDPINDYVLAELSKRRAEYTSSREISIFAGTFNLNGCLYDGDLSSWLFPNDSGFDCPDLVVIAFQEIVELTPGQILSADPGKRQFWEHQVSRHLNARDNYVLLRSGQLVGTALLLYVKASEVANVRNINGAVKKTGMGGMAGNKGGVAFSCDFASTKLCFITSHLAAGLSNVEDRNHDFRTIKSGIRFPRGKTLSDHDMVIWLGDFNYRIDLPNEEVRRRIKEDDLDALYRYDQLNLQMTAGKAFPYYNEAPINFNPTYKFDNNSDDYDSSDKARVPAWTDRVLTRGSNIRQIAYNSAGLRFSDHRPVYASFTATVYTIDRPKKEKLSQELYAKRRGYVGQLLDLDGDDSGGPLPPPSTDKQKWWLEGGKSARANIMPPQQNMILNHKRPANPFSPTNEPDFISIDQSSGGNPQQAHRPSTVSMHSAAAGSHGPPIPQKPKALAGHSMHPTPLSEIPPALPPRRANTISASMDSSGLLGDTDLDTPLQTFSGGVAGSRPRSGTNGTSSRTSSMSSTGSGGFQQHPSTTTARRGDFPSASLPKINRIRTEGSSATPPPFPPRPGSSGSGSSIGSGSQGSKALPDLTAMRSAPQDRFERSGGYRDNVTAQPLRHVEKMPPALPARPKYMPDASFGGVGASGKPIHSPVDGGGVRAQPALLDDDDGDETLDSKWKALA
ncbi:synaptojanin-2 [Myxozyma melibiosi]|uniref:phosphoinositide 5-phosphatase n=1 Tax=Myxozyma melibiosi TaxID=54550 RepID=A0ABR1F5A6_9ASCO